MPDTPIPEAPRTSNLEALGSYNTGEATPGITLERLAEIERWRRESTDPRDFAKKMAEGGIAPSFNAERAANLLLSFGGGKAKRNETSGEIEFTGDADSVEGQRFAEAKTVSDNIVALQKYTDLLSKAATAGQSPEDFAAASDPPLDLAEIRTAARNSINNELLQQLAPELQGIDAPAIKDIIDNQLIQNPVFRNELATILSQIKMPRTEIADNLEAAKFQENKDNLTAREGELATRITDQIKETLRNSGIDATTIDGDEVKKIIEDQLKFGKTPETILYEIEFDLTGKLFADRFQYTAFQEKQKRINKIREELLRPGLKEAQKEDINRRIDEVKAEATWDGKDYDAWKADLEASDDYKNFLRIRDALSYNKTGNTYDSPIARKVQERLQVQHELKETEEKLAKSQTEGARATSTTRDERLEQERQVIEQLRGAIPRAVARTILENAQQIDVVRQRENTRNFDNETRQMFETVRISMRERGFGYRDVGGRLEPNNQRAEVLADARRLALDKDRGLQNVTLTHMRLLGTARLGDDGNPHPDGGNIQSIDDLNARQRAMFDRVFASESQAIKTKVARDLMLSQSFRGKILDKLPIPGRDKNGLSDREWEEFGKFFKNDTEKIINSTKEGRDAVAELERAGIKPDSTRGRNILMWLAIILGGGMTIASMGGLATVIPALAGTGISGIKAVATGFGGGTEAVVKGA